MLKSRWSKPMPIAGIIAAIVAAAGIPKPVVIFAGGRYALRETVRHEMRERAEDLQRCFDRMGDFDEERR